MVVPVVAAQRTCERLPCLVASLISQTDRTIVSSLRGVLDDVHQ
jgi:hypothetical protein